MSLLDRGNAEVIVYPEEVVYDTDGNPMTRPSAVGHTARAELQLQAQSGTSSRRAEQDNEGFEIETVYRLRFTRDYPHVLGAQSVIEWNGKRWSVHGDVRPYMSGSRRTQHRTYVIRNT